MIGNLINSLEFKGVEAARKIATIGTLLETGQPLEDLKERSDKDGTTEQDGQGGENTV